MNNQDAITTINQSLVSLSNALKEGRNEILDRYLVASASFHRYSFRNVNMIYAQNPEATFVAGYNAWKKRGRWVVPGQSGIAIFAPLVGRRATDDTTECSPASSTIGNDERPTLGFRIVFVFDVSQTDGEPIVESAAILGEPGYNLDVLLDIYRQLNIKVVFTQLPGMVQGYSLGGEVRVSDDLGDSESFRVLVHELAHEMMHKSSLYYRADMKPLVETEAEAVAFVVSTACGVDHLDRSADYITLHQGDTKLLGESLARVHDTASKIIVMIEQQVGDREFERQQVYSA